MIDKRILILSNYKVLTPVSGIYTFYRGLCKVANQLDWQLDVMVDNLPKNPLMINTLKNMGATIIHPEHLKKDKYETYSRFKPTQSLGVLGILQLLLAESFQSKIYDAIIVHNVEGVMAPLALDLDIPIIMYTHDAVFIHDYYCDKNYHPVRLFDPLLQNKNVFVATQSQYNVDTLKKRGIDAHVVPMALPDIEIFDPVKIDKKGVLFIGRWETLKQPKQFIKVMKEIRDKQGIMPVKVMTSKKGVGKWENALKDIGYTNNDYEIKYNIYGAEKRDFIASAKVFYMPSKAESFSFAFCESISLVDSIAHKDADWTANFDPKYCYLIDKKEAADIIIDLYNNPSTITKDHIKYVKSIDNNAIQYWNDFINEISKPNPNKKFRENKSGITKHRNFWLRDYPNLVNHKNIDLYEIELIYKLYRQGVLKMYHTKNDTWITMDNIQPNMSSITNSYDLLFDT